ncbi:MULTISPECIES: RluA family pseudouridine synthase [Sphingobacterium]|uniref:Pseudouridine synthase n=1 Tax=Sphingobacterium tenebrionis TaxID=3111775 RepID=A0ABU8I6U1_9SPHI|nr:RluA family pseudouridine synthase [Sphingobacterium sp. CZ-2]QBR11272.1 RluA family pseudouridine synthase [Sphingobacterium sp. CZ-2]
MSNISFLHRFQHDVSHIKKPEKFTFPFCYEPHALSMLAAKQVQEYLLTQKDFEHNFGLDDHNSALVIGKMFGVLVVEDEHGGLGYLAAVSGKLAGTNQHRYFVPPIFDMLKPEGFFLEEEQEINRINRELEQIEENGNLQALKLQFESAKEEQQKSLSTLRVLHKQNKSERKQIRTIQKPILSENAYQELEIDLIKQSYRDQHEYDVAKGNALKVIERFEEKYLMEQQQIEALKNERKERSSSLQQRLFDQYHFLNAQGESRSVLDIFQEAIQLQPPAGAGECAAPKLLQFAYQHKLKPIAMAEFWWGESPNTEVRKHLSFYPACRGKCEPILNHMLQGLEVDDNPMLQHPDSDLDIDIIYEDESIIVVNKPAEFLSVPGINVKDSVQTRILERFPEITGPLIIHRLDMSTSGILVLAKNKESHQFIQDQFIKHTVKKRYTAILDGVIDQQEGLIDLPLRVDLDDRPRQVVCYEYGKPAQTKFRVQAIENGRTRIHYFPLTGRTHQLRVHSAHKKGLFCPILGDDLYGQRADRLHLHAGFIEFTHPISKERISFTLEDPF